MSIASAGYSGTPLPRKLGVKPESRLLVINDPANFYATLGHPSEAAFQYDVIVLFTDNKLHLLGQLQFVIERLAERGGLWIAWPKKASKVPTDISEDTLREVVLPTGLVDNKVCAIDEIWSGLRFVRRRAGHSSQMGR